MIPKSFQALGKICLIKTKNKQVAREILEKRPQFKSVYFQGKISGNLRKPNVVWLAGERNTLTRVRENYCDFIIDISKVMFSKGNQEEKRRIVKEIKDGDEVLDMFAGIGYFTIPIAKLTNCKKIWAIELNPDAVELLKQNLKLNKVENKVEVIQGDSKTEAIKLGRKFDKILMGFFKSEDFLCTAKKVAKQKATIYMHFLAKENEAHNKIKNIAKQQNLKVVLLRKIKEYAPRINHYVAKLKK